MPPISKYARSIGDGFGKFARAYRDRWPALTITILFICAPVYAMVWWLNIHDYPATNIAITILVTTMLVIRFLSQPEPLTITSLEIWISVFCLFGLALAIGNSYDWQFISFSAILIVMALPWCLIVGEAVRRERLLVAGLIPALIAMMVYWFAWLGGSDTGFDLSLLPLPIFFIGGAIWAPVALLILKFARQHRDGGVSGPGTQVLAMTMLFFPTALIAITLPPALRLSAIWSEVSLALIAIFLSGAISAPLRCVLIEWGQLAPHKK